MSDAQFDRLIAGEWARLRRIRKASQARVARLDARAGALLK